MTGGTTSVCYSAQGITWVQDAEQTLLVREGDGRSWQLRGAEAMVWDLLTLGYSWNRLVELAGAALRVPGEQAQETLWAILSRWEREGLVRACGDGAHG